ncbi:MAG: 30S ribosomal protein S12 methylthiotransferase RimO [Bacteroidetes bacterium]|nr:30S ribosomal protein S12 methylthiotransferase RimO [Rhodothermia bacterium]MCS7155376.1 30S ribosomal protein S12 methylthiotransferase RimO [Bacteroidota bacterium]MCX7907531.1 30S ribosomal protein S12 methylthiotransferase RimO [Bacteroidota bacterium]MDW8138525.1 30S ribosomal protein S12 methylthiotransferase RimO [Bacteroidota bacterium]MDW8284538.1 30S ribosomal protein S12 methylthiotransferase RimO [Bacteroidota bacterium]
MHTKRFRPPTVSVVSLGCAKNLVDSEVLLGQLAGNQYRISSDPERADVLIINTCGFIEAAKTESIQAILEALELKAAGRVQRVYVAGCLTERYRQELHQELPEVDGFFGTSELRELLAALGADYKANLLGERLLLSPPHYAYLKISEGCNHPCSFCAIPLMRGRHRSRPMEEIIHEAQRLTQRGVRELILIAQDLTYYGLDLYGRRQLAPLLRRLSEIDDLQWIRLMYAYPAKFPYEVLDVMAERPNICKYLDIPVQHLSDPVLASMRRGITGAEIEELVQSIRDRVPGVALRTTLIVGYPTETEDDFARLLEGMARIRFDRLGVFTYSQEENTAAYALGDPIAPEEKEARALAVMNLQQRISLERNQALVGKRLKVLIDRIEGRFAVGRTEYDAPEVDNEVYVSDPNLRVGHFYWVDIRDAEAYDLFGDAEAPA